MESPCMQWWNCQPLVWTVSEGAKGDLWASVLHTWMDDHALNLETRKRTSFDGGQS